MQNNIISENEEHLQIKRIQSSKEKQNEHLMILGKEIENINSKITILKNNELMKSIYISSLVPKPVAHLCDLNQNLKEDIRKKNIIREKMFFYNKVFKKPKCININNDQITQEYLNTESSMFKSNVPRLVWKVNNSTSANIGPGSFYKEPDLIRDKAKESFFFKKRSCSSKQKRTIELENYFNKNSSKILSEVKKAKNHIPKIKWYNKKKEYPKHRVKTDISVDDDESEEKVDYFPHREISSIFKSKSVKGIFLDKNHIPGPSYYDPMPVPRKFFFKNTHNIWM